MRVLLSFLLCFSLCVPSFAVEADSNEYYHYDEVGDYGIMPLDLTSSQSVWLQGIYDRLYYGNQSAAWFLNQIYTYVGHNNALGSLQSLMNDVKNYLNVTNGYLMYSNKSAANYLYSIDSDTGNIASYLYFGNRSAGSYLFGIEDDTGTIASRLISGTKSAATWLSDIASYSSSMVSAQGTSNSRLSSILSSLGSDGDINATLLQILEKIEAGNAKDWPTVSGIMGYWSDGSYKDLSNVPFSDAFRQMMFTVLNSVNSPFVGSYLGSDGSKITDSTGVYTILQIMASSFLGLADRISSVDRQTVFSFLPEDITKPVVSATADNLLDALGIMGTQLQNPLQRLAYVFANPQDLEMRENVSDNTDEANEQFFKPGSAGSVSPGNIKDAASMTSAASDFLDTGATASDAFSGLSGSTGLWGFFSQAAMDDMLGNPPPVTHSLGDLDEEGFYSPSAHHLQQVDVLLGKGG